jgi:hypothetical protein
VSRLVKGLVLAVVQVGLVASLGAKLLYDRTNLPRVWALTVPVDPELPLRGRYVQLRVVVDTPDIPLPEEDEHIVAPAVALRVVDDGLVAVPVPDDAGGLALTYFATEVELDDEESGSGGEEDTEAGDTDEEGPRTETVVLATLAEPLAFFIPEHMPDPSIRAENESLWVEVTVPRRGPPRPIRLGVQTDDGPIVPLR